MQIKKLIFITLAGLAILSFTACENNDDTDNSIIPAKFRVDVPGSLSTDITTKSTSGDTLSGDEIYQNLKLFIGVGEAAAVIVEDIIYNIRYYNIENVTDEMFPGDDDGRIKHLVVEKEVENNGVTWEYMLTITDYESEGNEDGGLALQVFWNNNPIEGIAVFNPYNINHNDGAGAEALYKIEYSAAGNAKYNEYMIVEIAGIALPSADVDAYAVESMKMFVGRSGNYVDVYGNSNHPNAKFDYINDTVPTGFNWAFVASAKASEDIAVAEVGLPSSTNTSDLRSVLLEDNSIKTVLTREVTNSIATQYPEIDPIYIAAYIAPYLKNTEAPGYFTKSGFVAAGVAPGTEYADIESRITSLTPFVPAEVSNLVISFMQ